MLRPRAGRHYFGIGAGIEMTLMDAKTGYFKLKLKK